MLQADDATIQCTPEIRIKQKCAIEKLQYAVRDDNLTLVSRLSMLVISKRLVCVCVCLCVCVCVCVWLGGGGFVTDNITAVANNSN